MFALRAVPIVLLIVLSNAASSTDTKDCANPNEVAQIICDLTASNMRVRLKVLTSLGKNSPTQASEAIGWLEQSLVFDEFVLKQYEGNPSCFTSNVREVLQDLSSYHFLSKPIRP